MLSTVESRPCQKGRNCKQNIATSGISKPRTRDLHLLELLCSGRLHQGSLWSTSIRALPGLQRQCVVSLAFKRAALRHCRSRFHQVGRPPSLSYALTSRNQPSEVTVWLMRQVPDIRGGPAGPHHRHLLGHLGDLLLACPSIFPFYDSLCLSLTSCHPTSAPRAAEASSCALSWKGSLSPSLSLFLFVSLLPVTPPRLRELPPTPRSPS